MKIQKKEKKKKLWLTTIFKLLQPNKKCVCVFACAKGKQKREKLNVCLCGLCVCCNAAILSHLKCEHNMIKVQT